MKLSKALKEKKVLVKEITSLKHRIGQYNSVIKGSNVPYSVEQCMKDLSDKRAALIELKVKICKANLAIQDKIFEISELKDHVAMLRGLNTNNGIVKVRGYGETSTDEYIATYDVLAVDAKIRETEVAIDSLQEQLDQYNHTTEI